MKSALDYSYNMQLFYSASLDPSSTTYILPRDESKHVVRVLRKREGDEVQITNGKGYLFQALVADANPNKCSLEITEHSYQSPSDYKLHIAVAPTKANDRFEWFLEKATEIGVSEITPLLCDHSERKQIKMDRYEKILQSAMKQSLNYHLPLLRPLTPFKDFIDRIADERAFIAHCEAGNKKSLKNHVIPKTDYTILIGPEGDFSLQEIDMALKSRVVPITLGSNRLRTETAAIVACHSVAFLNE